MRRIESLARVEVVVDPIDAAGLQSPGLFEAEQPDREADFQPEGRLDPRHDLAERVEFLVAGARPEMTAQ